MPDRKSLLSKLNVGELFHAEAPNGASLLCLIVSIDKTHLRVRRITSQDDLIFDRQTGTTEDGDVIDSIARLPTEIHDALLELDLKYQKFDPEKEPERFRLTEAEKNALRFVGPYYSANPLPPVASLQ
jgi:hypothetical protein